MAFDPKNFTVAAPKSVPVLLLLDTSGSMSNGARIEALNKAVESMLWDFKQAETNETFIKLSVITFGLEVNLHLPLQEVSKIDKVGTLTACGMTPLGTALRMAKAMIEDREIFVGRDYRPAVVLLSDGGPNDDWEVALDEFVSTGRSAKCDRFSVAIGNDCDMDVMRRFCSEGNEVLTADDASGISGHFKKITMSVSMRLKSVNKNEKICISNELDRDANASVGGGKSVVDDDDYGI